MPDFSDQFTKGNTVRICAQCDREQRIDLKAIKDKGWNISHGVCVRHAISTLKSAGLTDEEIKQFMAKSNGKSTAVKDLNEPENKDLVTWFKNPSEAPKAENGPSAVYIGAFGGGLGGT
jgi:hypothetical protein